MSPQKQKIELARFHGIEVKKLYGFSYDNNKIQFLGYISSAAAKKELERQKNSTNKLNRNKFTNIFSYDSVNSPDYLNDLNAIHELEKLIPEHLWSNYLLKIDKTSPAKYRAEVLLKIIKKWKEK